MNYRGFPIVPNLTSITPSITATRARGVAPMAIHVHAADTVAAFSDGGAAFRAEARRDFDPYLDLEYRWDFGDPDGDELVDPTSGLMVRTDSDQDAPEAAHVYRDAGTYKITLRVRAWTGTRWVVAETTTITLPGWHQFEIVGNPTGGWFTLTLGGVTTGAIVAGPNALASQASGSYEGLWTDLNRSVRSTDPRVPAIRGDGTAGNPYNCLQQALDAAFGAGRVIAVGVNDNNWHRWTLYQASDLATVPATLSADSSGMVGGTSPRAQVRTVRVASSAGIVAVGAFSGPTMYFDSVAGDDSAAGDAPSAPRKTWAAVASFLRGGAGRRALLRRGSSWTSQGARVVSVSGIQLASYGDQGPPPVVTSAAGVPPISLVPLAGGDIAEVVLSGIDFTTPYNWTSFGWGAATTPGAPAGVLRDVLVDDCRFAGTFNVQASGTGHGLTIWRCTFDDRLNHDPGTRQGVFVLATGPVAVVGCAFRNGGTGTLLDHHSYIFCPHHQLELRCDFAPGVAVVKNFCSTNPSAQFGEYRSGNSSWRVHSGCDYHGASNGVGHGWHQPYHFDATQDRVVVQGCRFHDLPAPGCGQGMSLYVGPVRRFVARDNSMYGNWFVEIGITDPESVAEGLPRLDFYRNRVDRMDVGVGFASTVTTFGVGGGYWCYNRVRSDVGQSTLYGLFDYDPAALASWRIDHNQFYAPNCPAPFRDRVSRKFRTWAEWQSLGMDTQSVYADPGWPAPRIGDFGDPPPAMMP